MENEINPKIGKFGVPKEYRYFSKLFSNVYEKLHPIQMSIYGEDEKECDGLMSIDSNENSDMIHILYPVSNIGPEEYQVGENAQEYTLTRYGVKKEDYSDAGKIIDANSAPKKVKKVIGILEDVLEGKKKKKIRKK